MRALLGRDSYASDTPAGKRVVGLAAMAKLSQLEARLDEQSKQLDVQSKQLLAVKEHCAAQSLQLEALATQNSAIFAMLVRMKKWPPLPVAASPNTA